MYSRLSNITVSLVKFNRLTSKIWGRKLSIDSNKSKEKKLNVCHSSKLCSKSFDFGIECFSKSISRTIDEEVQHFAVMFVDCSGYDIEASEF